MYYDADDDSGFDVGYGEDIFTLTAKNYGECTFRMAYVRPWEFSTFEDYAKKNGYIISIPIRVLVEGGDSDSGADPDCDPSIEECLPP